MKGLGDGEIVRFGCGHVFIIKSIGHGRGPHEKRDLMFGEVTHGEERRDNLALLGDAFATHATKTLQHVCRSRNTKAPKLAAAFAGGVTILGATFCAEVTVLGC